MQSNKILFTLAKKLLRPSLSTKQLLAIMLLGTLMLPIAMPVTAQSDNKTGDALAADKSLQLSQPTFLEQFSSLISFSQETALALFYFSIGGEKKRVENTYNPLFLPRKVNSFRTQLNDNQVITVGSVLSLSAMPLDKNGMILNGLTPKWVSSDPDIIKIANNSEAIALKEGMAEMIIMLGTAKHIYSVAVVSNKNKTENGTESPLMPEQPTDSDVVNSLFDPANNVGNPSGQVEMSGRTVAAATQIKERIGAANFSFSVPLGALKGRNLDVAVGMTYNSRVWNKINDGGFTYNYNVDRNWVTPGFNIGYGYLDRFIISGSTPSTYVYSYSLVDPDGTRHQISLKQTSFGIKYYESTDGTFIKTWIYAADERTATGMLVSFPDGSKVLYGSLKPDTWQGHPDQGRRFPVKITDRHGNIMDISYVQGDTQGKMLSIRDTMGRYINFHYNGPDLISITVPGFNNSSAERVAARFYYDTINLDTTTTRFSNGAVSPSLPSSITVLKYIYFPQTQNGFKYEYSNAWGVINKISNLRGMSVTSSAVLADGEVAATTLYNYPTTLSVALDDVPTYTTRTDDWLGRTTSSAPVTNFNEQKDVTNSRSISKTTDPNGVIYETWAKLSPGSWDDGLVTDTFIKTVDDPVAQTYKTWMHSKVFWDDQSAAAGRRNPRVEKLEETNDANQTRAVTFEYDDYNNATMTREYDFASPGTLGTELRATQVIYVTASNWINNGLFHLPQSVRTIVNSIIVSRTDYEYDGQQLSTYDGIVQFEPSYDPASPPGEYCYQVCPNDCVNPVHPQICDCEMVTVCDPIPVYNEATFWRGNLTKTTSFVDPSNDSDPNASVNTMKYDMAGNMVEASMDCCNIKTFEYSVSNYFAYLTKETRGSSPQLINQASYDFNTGLLVSANDENGQDTTFTYDSDKLLQTRVDHSNGAWSAFEYNWTAFPYNVKTTRSMDATRSISVWEFANGRGQPFRVRSLTANGYLSSDLEFDNVGRPVRAFNPYTVSSLTTARPSGIKYDEVTQTDGLGRNLQSTLQDNTVITSEFSGTVSTLTDQAGKKRRQVLDALGRLRRLDEPDASGSLGNASSPAQPTYYDYDGNDNMEKITQTSGATTQERIFKHDALSRLRWERQVEAVPTLNDAGQKVSSGGLWTGVYNYNTKNLLIDATDARGVKTTFAYDGLNRISTISYSGESGYQTPTVSYTYDEQHTNYFNKGQLTKIETAAVTGTQATPATVQNYDYDKVGQVKNHTFGIGSQSYGLQYSYNLGGQLISETYPSGKVVTNTIDNYGKVQTVADAQRTYLSSMVFNTQGLPSQINLGNGVSETFNFNDRFQLISQNLLKGSDVLQKYEYSFGQVTLSDGSIDASKNNGQLAKIEGFIGSTKQWSQRFAYDELGRLSETREYKSGDNGHLSYKQKFDFDRFGNLYRKAANNSITGQENPLAYTAIEDSDVNKSNNRITSNMTYDEAGEVTVDSKFRNMSFAYDGNGRVIKSTKTNTPDALTVYDGLNNRVAVKVDNAWQYRIYDIFGQLVAEYGSPTDGPGGTKFIQQDIQGSVRTITNSNGFVISRIDHQAFGEEIGAGVGLRSIEQAYNADPVTIHSYGLTERDQATGQQHTSMRKLETEAGRWNAPDPFRGSMAISNPQSFNGYTYVGNDPVNFVDPSGLMPNMCGAEYSYSQCTSMGFGGFASGFREHSFFHVTDVSEGEVHGYWETFYFPTFSGYQTKDGGGLKDIVNKRLDSGKCRDKLNALLKALGKDDLKDKKSGKTGIDALVEKFFGDNKVQEASSGNSNYDPSTHILTMNTDPTRGQGITTIDMVLGVEFIHEILHGAQKSSFSHEDIVKGIAGVEGINFKALEKSQKDLKGKDANDSSLFEAPMNAWISKYCGEDKNNLWDKNYANIK